jgi:hypothetical protein
MFVPEVRGSMRSEWGQSTVSEIMLIICYGFRVQTPAPHATVNTSNNSSGGHSDLHCGVISFFTCWVRILVLKTTILSSSWAHPLRCQGSILKWAMNRLLTYRFVIIVYDHTRIRFYTTSVINRGSLNNSGMESFIHQWLYSPFLGSRRFFFSFS